MSLRKSIAMWLPLLALSAWTAGAHETDDAAARRTSLRTIEGSVTAISTSPGEGDLPVVAVTLETTGAESERFVVLFAPERVMDEIAFTVEEGDALRARIFVDEKGPSRAHKVMNMTRGTMVRFRSLSGVPLWGARGEWEGGPCRERVRYRGGREGRGQGPRR
jgi:hypothetical protein